MDPARDRPAQPLKLGEDALGRIAAALSDLYRSLYDERPLDPHVSLTGNMLAYVFEGGLSIADERLLRTGSGARLTEFRRSFFDVVSAELVRVVGDLTGLTVTYSFSGFDPRTRTTHAIFVLDLSGLDDREQRKAVLNWSEQVRRNSRRLRAERAATREAHLTLKDQVHRQREALRRAADRVDARSPEADPGSGEG